MSCRSKATISARKFYFCCVLCRQKANIPARNTWEVVHSHLSGSGLTLPPKLTLGHIHLNSYSRVRVNLAVPANIYYNINNVYRPFFPWFLVFSFWINGILGGFWYHRNSEAYYGGSDTIETQRHMWGFWYHRNSEAYYGGSDNIETHRHIMGVLMP